MRGNGVDNLRQTSDDDDDDCNACFFLFFLVVVWGIFCVGGCG